MSDAIEIQEIDNTTELSDQGEHAQEVLQNILSMSQIKTDVAVEEANGRIRLVIGPLEEEDISLLVGRHGRTLHALQFIANRIVNRFPDNRKPITIEVAGFTDKHRSRLEELAGRLYESVTNNNMEVSIVGMNPSDRRTIHMATKDREGIDTFSQDEGIARRLVITPCD
ncbi:MAG TPA: KH domain-containing protein [Myxococcales bacterium]|nr:KH domain-containing protein [Myxococcales bacterium]HIN85272.1 KH domain-containing protein [Myxococcales bacterium]